MVTNSTNAGLTVRDCILLQSEFEKQAATLFPFPATVHLYASSENEAVPDYDTWPGFLVEHQQAACSQQAGAAPDLDEQSDCLGHYDGVVCCPLKLTDGGRAYLVFSGCDQALLKKISRDWLRSLQKQIQELLCTVQRGYQDPVTGLYTYRALLVALENTGSSDHRETEPTLYLLHLSFVRRSIPGTFHRIQYFADLLATIENQGIFYLDQGVYALLLNAADQATQRHLARRLQKFLRREKLQRVHIAFGDCAAFSCPSGQEMEPDSTPLDTMVKALALAERRGPFGICDVRVLAGQDVHPFVMPERPVLRKLQRLWRSLDRFWLALFVVRNATDKADAAAVFARLAVRYCATAECIEVSKHEFFVLVPDNGQEKAEQELLALHHAIKNKLNASVAVGHCAFPDLDQCTKTETVRRCYKALMHGRFYGQDVMVRFDHISLNVSGDWYFDQGDFRQAVREYSEGLKRMPGEKNLLNSLGVALVEMKQTARAITTFEQVLEQEPENHMALVNLGYACLQKGWRNRALKFFEKAHAVQYHAGLDGVDVLRQLSRLYIFFERFSDALLTLERWQQCEGSEGDFLLYQLLGRAHFETGSPELAMQSLQRALRIHPRDAESMSLLGLLYVREGEGADAGESLLKKALALESRQAACWYRYGAALLHVKRYDEALTAVRKSLALQKKYVDASLLLIEILARQANLKLARRHLDRLLRRGTLSVPHKKKVEKIFSDFFDKSTKAT